MGFADKMKGAISVAGEKAQNFAKEKGLDEKLNSVKDSVTKAVGDGVSAMKESNAENKELKKPLEGAIIRYEVLYLNGLPKTSDKKQSGALGLNVMEDCFIFTKTATSKGWFEGYKIPYERIREIAIEKRTISTAEIFLGAGNDANQQQENCLTFFHIDNEGVEQTLRVEMLTGTTIYNQAAKCKEFMDLLRQKCITKRFQSVSNENTGSPVSAADELLKFKQLLDAGVISQEEFDRKKSDLLK